MAFRCKNCGAFMRYKIGNEKSMFECPACRRSTEYNIYKKDKDGEDEFI